MCNICLLSSACCVWPEIVIVVVCVLGAEVSRCDSMGLCCSSLLCFVCVAVRDEDCWRCKNHLHVPLWCQQGVLLSKDIVIRVE